MAVQYQVPKIDINVLSQDVDRIFALQKKNQFNIANSTARERKAKIKKIQHAIFVKYRDEIKKACYDDFRKNEAEVDLTEIMPIVAAAKFARGRVSRWMAEQPVDTPIALFGTSSRIKYEPKGVVLIISPWNFAFNLTFLPLISAVAAGNCVMVKPSENTPHSSGLMKKIIEEIFSEDEVALIEGGVPETTLLLKKPFNHIFFTGAPSVGKIVMKAAAENLSSVSLELGGKSPTIVDASASLSEAAARIAWSKSMNNGQICIAPDYLYVHEDVKDRFIEAYKKHIASYYGANAETSESYNRIVNNRHFKRLQGYMDDAIEKNVKIELGGQMNADQNFITPTVVSGLDEDADLWNNEIFGPILPIRTFRDIQEPIDYINKGEKPLALYLFSKTRKNVNLVKKNTRSGAMVINHNAIHYFNNNLPFGGSNNSGIGKGNGVFGFRAFSNAKGIMKQWSPIDGMKSFRPPYTGAKKKMINFVIKYLS